MPSAVRNFLRFWLPVLLWAGLIFWGSTDALSAPHTSRFLVPFLRWLNPGITPGTIDLIQLGIRKAGHATEYGVLVLLLWRALRAGVLRPAPGGGWPARTALQAWLLATAYAGSDEFHQSFYPSREASVRDVIIDSTGAAAALVVVWWLGRRLRRW